MIGRSLSHFEITAKLGEGGMGEVYLARDSRLGRQVALKFLPPELQADKEARRRFLREAKAAAAIDHPYVCGIYEIGEHEGRDFLALEYVEGPTLDERLAGGPLPVEEVLARGVEIAEALARAHKAGIVHRDLKPANILLTPDGHVKVCDFGLAKRLPTGEPDGDDNETLTELTRESSTVGTLAYMAPEQLLGREVDPRSDLFSFGLVLYEMAAGRHPFRRERPMETADAILNAPVPPLARFVEGVPIKLEHTIEKMLAREPDRRYQSVHEVATNLSNLAAAGAAEPAAPRQAPTDPPSTPRSALSRRPWLLAAGVLALVFAALAAWRTLAPAPPLGERIPIAVVDVVNETGERELDGLSGMLITALEQSRRLSVLTRSRMFDILRQLDRGDAEQIDEALGRQICRVASVNWMAVASVRRFGKLYTLDLKILDHERNHYVLTTSETGEGQESIPGLIDRLADRTRSKLRAGSDVERPRVSQVTTPDLEAYQLFFEGEEHVDKLDLGKAIEKLQLAIERDPAFGLAYYRLGYALHLQNRNEEAHDALSSALELLDRIPDKQRHLARAYAAHLGHSETELRTGLAILREMERTYPNDKEMIFFIGDWSFHVRDYDVSREYLQRALAMDPEFKRALWHLALLYSNTGDSEQMLEVAHKVLALGEDTMAHSLVGVAYGQLGQYEIATASLERALAIERDPDVLQDLAWVQARGGDLAGAEATAAEAVELRPANMPTQYLLVEILLRQRRFTEARRWLEESSGERGDFHSANIMARMLSAAGNDPGEAIEWATRALKSTADVQRPMSSASYENWAHAYPYFPLAEHSLGLAQCALGDIAAAATWLRRAAELAPLRDEIREDLARCAGESAAAAANADAFWLPEGEHSGSENQGVAGSIPALGTT